ncbi:phage tail protein [Aequorivita marina]|uniref:phage tail protein n=1 Tax=Aequorivita marina TaxID=3073654 RepID=UPI002876D2D6|nr:phage tail protein [Aequorivita sp. S2608]MDS1297769.1 phage tail protein [Aequorivita sp. S2608]
MTKSTYPLLNMHFVVEFKNKQFFNDRSFQSVSGLKARVCENDDSNESDVHFENIILRRGYQPDSEIVVWCMDAINNKKKKPLDLVVKLLNEEHEMISGWYIESAVPVAWGVDELHAQETKVLIETIELSYQRFQVLNKKGKAIEQIKTSKKKDNCINFKN